MGRLESPPRLLIVDDEPTGREILNDILETQGYEIASASHGAAALELAAAFDPDLVLLDVMMPGMDGFEVCRRLRANPALADVAIVLITALDDRASRLRGIEAGADDFLSKPFDRVELRGRVQMITRLNRHRHLMAERAQRQAAEAQAQAHLAAEQLKDRFIADVSHELRTPLAALALLAGNLDMLYDQLSVERRREMIRKVRGHTRVLSELVENVLQLSRLDQRDRFERTAIVDLAGLLREEAEAQEPLSGQRSQRMQVLATGKLLVRGMPDLLRQVIRNLISNAIKYTPAGGLITCECAGGPGG
jgi:DNA-binding response OmpR family regulator